MVAHRILKKTVIGIIGSIVGVVALLFILSKFIHVNVDSMGGNTVYPPYPFIQPLSQEGFVQRILVDDWINGQPGFDVVDDYKGYGNRVLHWHEEDEEVLTIAFEVEQAGDYFLAFDYLSDDQSVKPDEITLVVNGNSHPDFVNIRLWTLWTTTDEEPTYDIYRNQVYQKNEPLSLWSTTILRDQLALKPEPLVFSLIEGINSIEITKEQGEFYLGDLHLYQRQAIMDYDAYLEQYPTADKHDHMIILEAENYTHKNSVSILPEMEKSPSVSPFQSDLNHLNMIGYTFFEVGQRLSYYLNIEESGYYHITLKYKNAMYDNRNSYRNIYINGSIPFEELRNYAFTYQNQWTYETLHRGDEPFWFYFEEGLHEITLEADASAFYEDYQIVQRIMDEIGEYSIRLKKLTGGETDRNREWNIALFIPETQTLFDGWYDDLSIVYEHLKVMKSNPRKSNELLKYMENALDKLDILRKDINKIPHRTNLLSTGSNSLAQLLALINAQIVDQPIALDQIIIHGDEAKLPRERAFFLKRWIAGFQIYQAASSFQSVEDADIEVWVNRSRYYISMMQQMTDATFTKDTGIKVRYSVMPNEQKLILANAANTQPDMALGISAWLPYELGLRGAAADMRQFDGFEETIAQFMPGSFLNMIHDGMVFGLPETQDFNITFYREDVMEALNIDVPNTYDELIGILSTLQRYGMNYYLPLSQESSLKGFNATAPFIFQQGIDLYSQDGFDVTIDTEAALRGINMMVNLYTLYSLPLQVPNFYNDFRDTTIPIGVSGFNTYVQLTFAAPEIANKWNIALAPGFDDGTGHIRRDNVGAAQASVIFNKSDRQEEAWRLLQWWMSAATQTDFIYNLLVTYGDGFLWNSANVEAFSTLPIPQAHIDTILEQWEYLHEVPKVPGGYKLERELSNVWNRVVFDGIDVRSAVDDAKILITRELERKYIEFGYMDKQGNPIKPYVITTIDDVRAWMEEES